MYGEFIGKTKFLTNDSPWTDVFRARVGEYVLLDPDVDKDKPGNMTNSMVKTSIYLGSIGYERIFIYGADGHQREGSTHYKLDREDQRLIRTKDTNNINSRMNLLLDEHNIHPEIYNCCPTSAITCFKKITVEESIEMMK
jgi:hypothetical protein